MFTMLIKIIAVVSCFLLVTSFSATTSVDAAVSCDDVKTKATPCVDYGKGEGVLSPCCEWLQTTFAQTGTSVDDKKAACNCLNGVFAAATKGLKDKRLKQVPQRCGVQLPFKLRKNSNCDSINN